LVRGWGFMAFMDLRALRAERRPRLRDVVSLGLRNKNLQWDFNAGRTLHQKKLLRTLRLL
jgi:hypothetical protein